MTFKVVKINIVKGGNFVTNDAVNFNVTGACESFNDKNTIFINNVDDFIVFC